MRSSILLKNFFGVRCGKRSLSSQSKSTILVFGDSNTWGYNPDCCNRQSSRFDFDDRWTSQLDKALHNKYHFVVEGLNARTTVFNDMTSPCDGEYDCNGRRFLTTILHSHKPLKLVVLALGTNDLKAKFHASPYDIVAGVRSLIRDVTKATDVGESYTIDENGLKHPVIGGGKQCDLRNKKIYYETPKILVLGPPVVHHTHFNRIWGFEEGVEQRSRKTSALLSLACKELGVGYLNMGNVAKVSPIDGVHFPLSEQGTIATAVAHKISHLLQHE